MTLSNRVSVAGWAATDGLPAEIGPSDGCSWVFDTLTGWWGGLAPRGNPQDRTQADGTFDGQAPLPARIIVVSGTLTAPDPVTLQAGMDTLAAVLSGPARVGLFTVEEPGRGLSRFCTVRLSGEVLITRTSALSGAWSISLYAPDPLRYSSQLHTLSTGSFQSGSGRTYSKTYPYTYGAGTSAAGVVQISNAGNIATGLTLRLQNMTGNAIVQQVGGVALVSTVVAPGSELVIDTAARTVMLGSSSRRQFMTLDSQWFLAPPGQSAVYFTAPSGVLVVQWRDAWS